MLNQKGAFFVGLFTLAVIAVCAAGIVFFLNEDKTLRSSYEISIAFENVEGIQVGSPVTLEGKPIGSVSELSFGTLPESEIPAHWVQCRIWDDQQTSQWIKDDSSFELVTENLFGDKRVEIGFGLGGTVLKPGGRVVGGSVVRFQEVLTQVSSAASKMETLFGAFEGEDAPDLGELIQGMSTTMTTLGTAAEGLQPVITYFQKNPMALITLLGNLQIALQNGAQLSKKMKSMMDTMEKSRGGEKKMVEDLDNLLKELEKAAKAIQEIQNAQKGF